MTDFGLRFYAGAPLLTPDDHRIGTVCVLDTEPQSPPEATLDHLSDLAEMVMDELELRRERAEHEQSRELLRQSQRLADVGGSACDPQTEEVTWTDQTYRIFGLSPEADLDLETAVDFYGPDSRSVIQPEVERLLDEGGHYDLELDVVTADGDRRRVCTVAEAQRENGETTQIVGAIQDVTEQHRDRRLKDVQSTFFERIATGEAPDAILDEIARFTEAELPDATVSILRLDEGRLLHAAGPSLPDAYVETIDGVEIGPDAGTCGAVAYRKEDVVTEDIQEDDRWDDFRAAAEQAGFRSCSSQVIRGSEGTVFGTFAIYRDEPGVPNAAEQQLVRRMSHVASVALERARRERALRKSEERWHRLVDKHPGPIHVSVDGEFVYVNEAAAELHGLESADALVGHSIREYIHPEEENRTEERLQTLHEDREAVDLAEIRIRRADGTDRIVRVRSVPIRYEGEAAAQTMMRDVTGRRRAEREVREQKELLQTVFDHAPVMIMLAEDGELKIINDEFKSVTGWTDEDLDSQSDLLERSYPDPEVRQDVMDAIEEAPDDWRDFRPRRADGTRVDTTWKNVSLGEGRRIGFGVDISERKERERALKDTNRRLRLALDAANWGTFDWDLSSDRVLWDKRSLELYGLDFDPAFRDADLVRELVLEEDLDQLEELVRRAVEEGEDRYEVSYRFRRADDGDVRYIRSHGFIVRNEDGTAERIIGINQDVTERKEREQRLRMLSKAVSQAHEAVLITEAEPIDDPGPRIVYVNEALEEMTGYAEEEVLGKTPRLSQGPETERAVLDSLRSALEAGETWAGETINYRKYGTPYHQEWNLAPVKDETGEIEYWVSVQRDVTEEREREATMRRQKNLLEQTQRPAGAWEVDLRTGEVRASEETRRIYERDPDATLGLDEGFDFTVPEAQPVFREAFEQCVEEKQPYDLELPIETAKGNRRWVRTVGAPSETEDGEVAKVAGAVQDITERKESRRESEQYLEYTGRLLDAIDDLFFAIDEEARSRRWNDSIPAVTGYTDAEIEEMTAFDLVPESDHERLAATITDALETGHAQIEVSLLRKDGTTVPYEFVGSLVEHPDGGLRAVGIGRDVTERRRRKRQLHEERDLLNRILDTTPAAITVLNTDGEFIEASGRAESVLGLEEGEITDRTHNDPEWQLQTPDGRPVPDEELAFAHVMETKSLVQGIEHKIAWPDETERLLSISGAPLYSSSGALEGVVLQMTDITERRKAERKLERQNDLFERAQEIASVGAWEYDVQTDELTLTDQGYRVHGLAPDGTLTPARSHELFHPEDRPKTDEAFRRAVEEGEPYDLEARLITEDGDRRWVRTRGEPQREDGEIVRVRGAIQDVTEQARRRAELKEAKDAAEEADRIKSALLSNMNHEFRTPLTSIISFSELIVGNPEKAETFADRIHGGGKRLLHTLNTVMDFAELEADALSLTPKRVDLGTLARSVVGGFRIRSSGMT